jgi:hypothetical protein
MEIFSYDYIFTSCSDSPKFRISEVRVSEALLYVIVRIGGGSGVTETTTWITLT